MKGLANIGSNPASGAFELTEFGYHDNGTSAKKSASNIWRVGSNPTPGILTRMVKW